MNRFLIPALGFLALLPCGFAIVDVNQNGLSDLWEKQYNGGELFGESFDSQDDQDGDGWSNAKEALSGTDPSDGTPPAGWLVPQTDYHPSIWVDTDDDGIVDSQTVETAEIKWLSLIGKQYQLSGSPDLMPGTWLEVDEPRMGTGGEIGLGIPLRQPDGSVPERLFWRVAVRDIDTDGDSLTDHEEHQFGSNPASPMTNSGIPDAWVAANFPSAQGFDPNGDPDDDNITNALENQLGLDPNSADVIGLVNPGFDEAPTAQADFSFRETMFPYPSDLYPQDGIPGWQADAGGHIELWDEGYGNTYVELQSHFAAHGVKQEFDMLPGSRVSFILRYKGRYAYDAHDNAFDLEVEGASELLVDGSPSTSQGSTKSHSFMDDDDWDKYDDWHCATVSITAESGGTGLKPLTLSFVPKTTTTYGANGQEEITYGGFVDLLPVDVAVDADRDGEITFDGKDKTTAEKPYRFWINDDRDIEGTVDGDDWEEDDIYVHPTANGGRDTDSFNLEVARDLEDLTRVWIDFSGINSVFPASDSSVKLKVRIDSSSAERARIILYQPVETSGGRQYLKDEGTGYNQLQGDYGKELCRVGISSTEVPRRGWETLGADKVIHFLFEGLNKGDGKLIFELWKDGEKVCDLPPVNLLLKKATEMYETWTVGDVAAPGVSYSSWPASSATQTSGQGIPAPEKPEEKDYVMFVHGWNMESWEKETFASTMFKRMWHQGYKGRFGAYTWPTFHSLPDYFDTSHFDGSEERAWNSAAPLHALTASLAGTFKDSSGKSLVRLYAHSMGNVVASEAMRQMKANSSVHTYISAQAALSSHVWDNTTPDMTFFTPTTPNVYGYHWQSSPTSKPHQWQPEGRPSYMAPLNMPSSTVFINHYNPLDWALSYARWQLNQSLKPDVGYHYDNANPIDPNGLKDQFWESPAQVLSFPNNRFEIFAFAAESRAFATGQQGATSGMFDTTKSVNLNGASFQFGSAHKGHSAQFRSTIQKRWTYWTQALDDMDTQTPSP